jgi:hypothetical protein
MMSHSKPTFPLRAFAFVALLVCVHALAVHAAAQATQPPPQSRPPAPAASPTPTPDATAVPATTTADNHDLSITANVTARELLFEAVPNPKVEFPGQPRRDTLWEAERTNLPPQVQPGVTYRDIGIRLKITSVFADIERIVAEALGEIPVSADPSPKPEPDAVPPATTSNNTSRASSARTTPARRSSINNAATPRQRKP